MFFIHTEPNINRQFCEFFCPPDSHRTLYNWNHYMLLSTVNQKLYDSPKWVCLPISDLILCNQDQYISLYMLSRKLIYDSANLFFPPGSNLTTHNKNHLIFLSKMYRKLIHDSATCLRPPRSYVTFDKQGQYIFLHILKKRSIFDSTKWFCNS